MKMILGIGLLLIGIILLYFGYNEYNSMSSEISEVFTGSPSDNAVWYLTGGAGATIVGVLLILTDIKTKS
jgi:uncharacterized membrane protein YidH (DUF202 family)